MLYFSELTNEKYETVEELEIAEAKKRDELAALEAKKAERKKRADEVEAAFKKVDEAREEARMLLAEFCKDFGPYHTSYTEGNIKMFPNLFEMFFR